MNLSQLIPFVLGMALGLPLILLLVSGIWLFALSIFVPRHRMILKLGLRNIGRRRAQSLLIIGGLTLSTTLIASALGIGDTMSTSIRNSATAALGAVDHTISQRVGDLPAARYARLRDQLQAETRIDGLTAALSQDVAMVHARSGQGEPVALVWGVGPEFDQQFGVFGADGAALRVADLAAGEVYLNQSGADKLQTAVGDTLQLYAGSAPIEATVRGIIRNDGLLSAGAPVAVLGLTEAQKLLGKPDAVSTVLVSVQDGADVAVLEKLRVSLINPTAANELVVALRDPAVTPVIESSRKTLTRSPKLKARVAQLQTELAANGTSDALRSLLADSQLGAWLLGLELPSATKIQMATNFSNLSELQVEDVKAQAIAEAEQGGQQFSQIFLVFSTFSILAGVLLVFLIFVMLAAERKSEMGMARAVGMKRRHLIQMFVTEGTFYDLIAALVGVGLGVAISYLMVGVVAGAFGAFGATGLTISYSIKPQSLVLAYVIGVALTFLVVTFASWRVSRLNIVAAIRDLPDMEGKIGWGRRIWRGSRGLLLVGVAALLLSSGYASESQILIGIGISLGVIGAGLVLGTLLGFTPLRAAVRDRLVYTLIGVALLALWLLPFETRDTWLGIQAYEQNQFIFFWAGLMMISGAIWVIVYNADVLLGALNRVFGRFGNTAPILKTATAYPMAARFRTGMTLAMFALVMFTIIAMVVVVQVNDQFFARRDQLTGGFDLQASVLPTTGITDLSTALADKPTVRADDIAATGKLSYLPTEMRQVNAKNSAWVANTLLGYDAAFVNEAGQHFAFSRRAPGYADDAAVWAAIRDRDDVVVVTQGQIASGRSNDSGSRRLQIEGVMADDGTMPIVELEVRDAASGSVRTVQVIGVLESAEWYGGVQGNSGIITALSGKPAVPNAFVIKVRAEADQTALAQSLEKTFLASGMNVESFDEQIDTIQNVSRSLNNLLLGFVALGLVVGIAALGVISSRSVVERRQQIGMLRAIGYKQRMVWLSFMLESSFISLLGIAIGTTFGLVLGWMLINDFAKDLPGLEFQPPWLTIGMIITVSYLCSLVTTILPARKAAKIYPAEALRYE